MKGRLSGKLLLNRAGIDGKNRVRGVVLQILLLCCAVIISAQPEGYYSSAEGKSGVVLQQALHEIIEGHTVLSYSALWSAFYTTDDRSDGTVWDMYSDIPDGDNPYDYSFGTNQCGNYSGEGSCYNREHSFPKSWFNDASPMYSDLFHLYPTDGAVNGMRGNYPFGETENPTSISMNGSELGPCSVDGYTGTVFEPIDEYKGDFARTYFYMAVRYYGEDAGWPGSPMVNGSQLKPWAKEMMFQWHTEDPVSTKETERNDAVYGYQGNRNPFIDRPGFVELMYGGEDLDEIPPGIDSIIVTSSTALQLWFNEPLDSLSGVTISNYTISGDILIVAASMVDQDNSVVELEVNGLVNGSYSITITGVADTAGNKLQLAIFPFEITNLTSDGIQWRTVNAVYPNLGEGVFFLEISGGRSLLKEFALFDVSGRQQQVTFEQDGSRIKFTTSAVAGTYFLKIRYFYNKPLVFPVLIH